MRKTRSEQSAKRKRRKKRSRANRNRRTKRIRAMISENGESSTKTSIVGYVGIDPFLSKVRARYGESSGGSKVGA